MNLKFFILPIALTINFAVIKADDITIADGNNVAADTVAIVENATDSIPTLSLAGEVEALTQALQVAIPFAETAILNDYSCIDGRLGEIDSLAVYKKIDAIKPLVPYSEKIAARIDNLNLLMNISSRYAALAKIGETKYSADTVSKVQDELIELFRSGNNLLNENQQTQIDELYEFASSYSDALAAFASLIEIVDNEIAIFRDKEDSDKTCRAEITRIISENETTINKINSYPYLAHLLSQYKKELDNHPRSLTPEIREELKGMTDKMTLNN